jgi:hypothetical protein
VQLLGRPAAPGQRRQTDAFWASAHPALLHPMDSGFNLASVLLFGSGLFCLTSLFFGTRGGYYDTDDYDGNGTAH